METRKLLKYTAYAGVFAIAIGTIFGAYLLDWGMFSILAVLVGMNIMFVSMFGSYMIYLKEKLDGIENLLEVDEHEKEE